MYPLQLEKYIPFRFSRFLTVEKKRMAIPLEIDHAPKTTFVSPMGELIKVIFFIIYLVPCSMTDLSNIF